MFALEHAFVARIFFVIVRAFKSCRAISELSPCKFSARSAEGISRTTQNKIEKNKFLPRPFQGYLRLSRYYLVARGKRSTIVTASVTRKAENLHFFALCIFMASQRLL